jgi:hypothetical protein
LQYPVQFLPAIFAQLPEVRNVSVTCSADGPQQIDPDFFSQAKRCGGDSQ